MGRGLWLRRTGWFVGLWIASVCLLGIVALVIRWSIGAG